MGQQQWRLFVSPALKAVRYNSTGMLQTGCSIRSRDKGSRGYKQLILNLLQNEFIIYTENILQSKATSRPGHPAAGLRYFVCIMKGAVSTCRVDRNSVRTLYLEKHLYGCFGDARSDHHLLGRSNKKERL